MSERKPMEPERREPLSLGRAAAKRVHTHYTWDRNASRAVDLARTLLAARREANHSGTA